MTVSPDLAAMKGGKVMFWLQGDQAIETPGSFSVEKNV